MFGFERDARGMRQLRPDDDNGDRRVRVPADAVIPEACFAKAAEADQRRAG
jgi:hypothetical protein